VSERRLYGYAEDELSCAVMEQLVAFCNRTRQQPLLFYPGFPENKRGCGNLKKLIPAVTNMAKANLANFILTDLDTIACSPELIRQWFNLHNAQPQPPKNLLFRIAEREVESWLIADRNGLPRFLGISVTHFDKSPDQLSDPKQHLLNILRKGRKKIHKQMLPTGVAHVGPEYNHQLCQFVRNNWNIATAVEVSPSLRRAMNAINQF